MKTEIRSQRAAGRGRASVLECGDLSPLCDVAAARQSAANFSAADHRRLPKRRYGRAPACGSPTGQPSGARDLCRFTRGRRCASGGVPGLVQARRRSGLKFALLCALAVWLLTSALCPLSSAQYSVDWSTLDGGGGTSTGGVYSVSGTLGPPDAGAMSGGHYSIQGGFWTLAALQTPGAPRLSVFISPTNTVAVSWPQPDTGWKLQATTNLVPGGSVWMELPPPYATNATSLYFVEPAPAGNQFYRLRKP